MSDLAKIEPVPGREITPPPGHAFALSAAEYSREYLNVAKIKQAMEALESLWLSDSDKVKVMAIDRWFYWARVLGSMVADHADAAAEWETRSRIVMESTTKLGDRLAKSVYENLEAQKQALEASRRNHVLVRPASKTIGEG